MAGVNYASKYSERVDERFRLAARTNGAVNNDYDFVGVNAVNVYSIPTAPLNDYSMTGSSRYGTPAELENSVQTMTLSQDKAFTFTIDRRNYTDTMMTQEAGAALARQIDEVIVPTVDKYRLMKMAVNSGGIGTGAITASNAYDAFLDGTVALTNAKVPVEGRIAFVGASYYKLIKEDDMFIKAGDLSQDMLIRGEVGRVDGIPLILIPDSYLPSNVAFLITHPVATVSPLKFADYKIHDNPPGINGWLIEGRIYYDAFVLDNKAAAIYAHVIAPNDLTITSVAGTAPGDSKITVTETAGTGEGLYYKVGAAPVYVIDGDTVTLSQWTALTSGSDITAATGSIITVIIANATSGEVVSGGTATVTAKA